MTTNPKPYITKASIVDEIYSLDQALPKYKLSKLVRSELSKRLEILKRGATKQVDNLLLGDLSSSDEDCEDPVSAKPRLQIKQKKVKIQEPTPEPEETVYEPVPPTHPKTLPTDPAGELKPIGKATRKIPTVQQSIRYLLAEFKKHTDQIVKPYRSKSRSVGLTDFEADEILDMYQQIKDDMKTEVNFHLDSNEVSDAFYSLIEQKISNCDKLVEQVIN